MAEDRFATAKFEYAGRSSEELSFKAGDVIKLISFNKSDDWWEGSLNGASGLFPATYVEKIKSNSYKQSMEPREAPVSSKIQELQKKANLNDTNSQSAAASTKKNADPEPATVAAKGSLDADAADEIEELEKENELLRTSAEQLVTKLKELKATEVDLAKKLAEALKREEELMNELKEARNAKSAPSDDAEEIKALEEENELLRKSAEQLIGKINELKTQVAKLTESDSSKSKKITDLEAEVARLKSENESLKKAAPAATPAVTPTASSPVVTPATPAAASAASLLSPQPKQNRFASLARAAAKANAAAPTITTTPAASPSSAPSTPTAGDSSKAPMVRSASSKFFGVVQAARANSTVSGLKVDDSVRKAYSDIRSDPPPISWALFSYDSEGRTVSLSQSGSEGLAALHKQLKPEDRAYAFVRVTTGDGMSARAKFVFITWVGERVSPLKKARVSTDRSFVKEVIREFALEIFANSLDDLAEATIMAAVRKAGGADYGSSTN